MSDTAGASAKRIATHFISKTTFRATPAFMKKTMKQAKNLLSYGYTEHEVITAITYIAEVKLVNMYSLGYVNTCINQVLDEIKQENLRATLKQQQKETVIAHRQREVSTDDSSERNRTKSARFGVQRGFGEEYPFDLPEGSRPIN